MEKLLSVEDLAERTGIALVTMRRWLKRGWCPPYRRLPNGEYKFVEAHVEKWLQDMLVDPNSSSPIKGQAPHD